MKCLNCSNNEAVKHEIYGYMPCKSCQKAQSKFKVAATIEVTTGDIKESRRKYKSDITQRYRGNTPSLEYIKKYGTKGFTKEQVREAKNVWSEDNYYIDKSEKFKQKP